MFRAHVGNNAGKYCANKVINKNFSIKIPNRPLF